MKKILSLFLGLTVLFGTVCARGEDSGPLPDDSVLLWLVDMDDPVRDFAQPGASLTVGDLASRPDGYEVNGARVRVVGEDNVYLSLYSDDRGSWQVRGSQPYNTVVTFADDGEKVQAGPSWASLGAYASDAYSFVIELGHYYYDADDNFVWVSMAYGEEESYANLVKFRTSDIVADPTYVPWQTTYSVPEPTSGLLLLLGGSLLALRRRRRV